MSRIFYNLGRKVGPKARKVKWIWRSLTADEADTIQAERQVGQDLAYEIRQQLELISDPNIRQMLNEIGSRLTARVANKLRTFKFEAVMGAEPNAFALPGGFIYVTDSLLELCKWNKDEVAFILGHEMGHVIKGHAMDRIISNSAISAVSRAAPVRGAFAAWLRRVGVEFLESAYSQDLESEADVLGVRLAAAARYDPKASIRLLSRLAKLKQDTDHINLGSYFSSHPAFNIRIQNLNRLLRERYGCHSDKN